MRKLLILITIMALLTIGLTGATANQEQVDVYDEQKQLVKSVVFVLGLDQYFVNNQTPGVKMDARPFAEQGRTFVPVRYLSNALGVTDEHIGWESPKVTLDEPGFPVVELAVGIKQIKSDGKSTTMDVAPLARDGRTYLPARWVAEALGYEVAWDAENNIVLCWPKGTERPDVSDVIKHINTQAPVTPVQPPVNPMPLPEQPVTPPVQQPSGEVIDLTGKGESIAKYPWVKYLTPEYKINWLTYEEFNSNVYQLGNVKTYGIRVTKDTIYITSEGHINNIYLYEGGDVLRPRSNHPGFVFRPELLEKHEYGFTVVLDSTDKYGNGVVSWPTADITKISHIFLDWADTILAVENPLYQGGNK